MSQSNLERLAAAAEALGPLLDEIIFVGGIVTGLLITDSGSAQPRPTLDVDGIVEAATYAQYADFAERLRQQGFAEDFSQDAPLCRWRVRDVLLDVLPLNEDILGFSSRWYREASGNVDIYQLENGKRIRVVTAPLFTVMKLEAFRSRGLADLSLSKDLEDFLAVMDGRPELFDELLASNSKIRQAMGGAVAELLARTDFLDAIPGFLLPDAMSQARIPLLLGRLTAISNMTE